MIGLDFYEDQENSLDILIKFRDEHQQPESHTHEELFLPLTEISVTSHFSAASIRPHPLALPEEESLADQLVEKMRIACGEQERRAWELLGRKEGRKEAPDANRMKSRKGSEGPQEEEGLHYKRKIIRRKRAE